MGFPDRRTFRLRPAAAPGDRYAQKPGSNGSTHAMRPAGRPSNAGPTGAGRLTDLLGRTVSQARAQELCAAYGLLPRHGGARSYLARDTGLEIATDAHGTVTTVFLHFHGDDGFASFAGDIPGAPGSDPRRDSLHATLGHPDESGDASRDPYLGDFGPWDRWRRPGFTLHAQYALDGESLHRVTLT